MMFLLGIFFIVGIIQVIRGFFVIFDSDMKKIDESEESFWHYLYAPGTIFGYITVGLVIYYGCCAIIN